MRTFALLLSAALVAVAACGDDDDDDASDTTTPPPETTSSGEGPATTPPVNDQPSCWYHDDLVLARSEQTIDVIPEGLVPIEEGELFANLRDREPEDDDDAADLERLAVLLDPEAGGVAAFRIEDDTDPLLRAADLAASNEGSTASPVLLTTVTGHWSFAPGTLPFDSPVLDTAPSIESEPEFEPDLVIGVVDTGYDEDGSTPPWLADRVESAVVSRDADALLPTPSQIAGHGKFVASIIAQREPQARIVVAGMTAVDVDEFYDRADDPPNDGIWTDHELPTSPDNSFVSDEIELYLAIDRLLDVTDERGEPLQYDALNLSVGSYQCAQAGDNALSDSGLAIRAGIDLWRAEQREVPIVAAAGNHVVGEPEPTAPFLPADLDDDVIDVASVDDPGGTLSDFSNVGDHAAIGRNLVGVRLDDQWTCWSGSSFATAVVSGAVARAGVAPTPGDVVPLEDVAALDYIPDDDPCRTEG